MSRVALVVSLSYHYVIQTCLPLLLEKLSSDVLTAKLDSLYTLVAAAPVYGPVTLEPFLEQLWTAIEREVGMLVCVHAMGGLHSCYVYRCSSQQVWMFK